MKLITPPQFAMSLGAAVIASIIVFSLLFSYTNKANAGSERTASLTCSNLSGDLVTYNGLESSFTWYGDYNYVKVELSGGSIQYPSHMCILKTFKN